MTTQSSSLRIADSLVESPYAFPGSYPFYAYTNDGAALCKTCCKEERESIGTTTGSDGWNVIGVAVNYENDSLYCDHCSDPIEAAYVDS
jgi:hypothetical protein